jgi:hypothetical protein
MSRSSSKLSVPAAITVGVIAVIAVIASGALRPSPVTAKPGLPSEPAPSAPLEPAPSAPGPTRGPIDDFSDGSMSVRLDVPAGPDVYARVDDATGKVVDARSGRAGEGMSVPWEEIDVENVGPSILRLTWVALGNDDPVKVRVFESDGVINLVVLQLAPPPETDLLGYDRLLELEFDSPVDASDVVTEFIRGMDTGD